MRAKRLRVYRGKRNLWRWLLALLPLAALAGIGLLWAHDTSAGVRLREVELRLLDESGAPAPGVPVGALIDPSALPIGQWGELPGGETGADGRFRLGPAAPGSYWLRAAGNLYALSIPENAPDTLCLSLSTAPDRYTLLLRLRDTQGGPVAGRTVTLMEQELEKSPTTSFSQVKLGESDWQGELALEGAPAGGHLLCVEGCAPIPLVIEPNEKKTVSATLTVYPEPEGPVQERVTVYDGGRPLRDEPVMQVVYGLPGGREVALADGQTDGTGGLLLSLPAPGEYTLRVRTRRFKLQARGTGEETRLYL